MKQSEYQKFVLNYTLQSIQKQANCNKSRAKELFYKALALNLVQEEITNCVNFILEGDVE